MDMKILKLRRRKEKSYSDCNYDQLYRACFDLGQIFLENEEYEDALNEFREAEQAGEMAGITINVAKAKRMMGEVYILLQKPNEAVQYVVKYLELSKSEGDLKEEQRALATLARTYFILAESLSSSLERNEALNKAEEYNTKSIFVCDRLKDTTSHKDVAEMKARVYLNLGLVMEAQGRTVKAIEYLEKAVNICRTLDLWEELCLSYTSLGIAYKHCENTANAIKAFDLGLTVAARLPEKAKSMCDLLLLKAQVLFSLPDFRGAKHALHKAYKLRTPDTKDHLEIKRKLKIVAAMCKLEEKLVHMDENDIAEGRKMYESMGDGCADMESYKKALEYYHLTLKCAIQLGESGKPLADIYVSLASTYKDLKQFDKALDYYQQEFSTWKNNPAEACKTLLSIADIHEAKETPQSEIIATYKSARVLAKDAKNLKLERSVLKTFLRYLQEEKNDRLSDSVEQELRNVESRLGDNISSESDGASDEEDTVTAGIGDDICLETLTDSELDEDEVQKTKPRTTRRTHKSFLLKRNEKGETPLHTACINGNLALVQKLLDQGHPVDVRDNNGWLPLHEAANFGYLEIVRELLERGAAVNDRGGPSCGGITPLLDAASCGNLEVMELLLEKGASPTMRTNNFHKRLNMNQGQVNSYEFMREEARSIEQGETVLDCLRGWRERYEIEERHDLTGEILRDYDVMVKKVKAAIEKAGHQIGSKNTVPTKSREVNASKNTMPTKSREVKDIGHRSEFRSTLDVPKKKVNSSLRRDIDYSGGAGNNITNRRYSDDAVTEYEKAMRGLKHRPARTEVPVSPLKESQAALLQPDNVIDDWLVDDIGETASSRPTKRRRKEEFLGQQIKSSGPRNTIVSHSTRRLSSCSSSSENVDSELDTAVSSSVNEGLNSSPVPSSDSRMEESTNTVLDFDDGDYFLPNPFEPSQQICSTSQKTRKHQPSLLSVGISRQKVSGTQLLLNQSPSVNRNHSQPSTSFQLTQTLPSSTSALPQNHAVGISKQRTIKVLVEGKLLLIVIPSDPSLTISWLAEEAARRYKSMEGLEPRLSLQTVDGALLFPQDPLSLIFEFGCEIHATVTSWNLTPITQRYKDACITANVVLNTQVETQLDACQATSCLDLENYGLTSVELTPVFKALLHHHSLQHIRLSGNVLCDSGLKMLIETIVRLPQLRELDISCNNITCDGFSYMAQHISQNKGFQSLEVLDVSFNMLGDDCLRSLHTLISCIPALHTLRMSSVSLSSFKAPPDLSLENIEVLDVSYNKMGQEGAHGFLSKLNPDRVCSLNLAAVGRFVGREVAMFLGQCVPHNLVNLDLSYCDIDDADMVPLIECLQSCPQLQKLNLAGNEQLSSVISQQLLKMPLSELNLAGVNSTQHIVTGIAHLYVSSTKNSNFCHSGPFGLGTNSIRSLLSNN